MSLYFAAIDFGTAYTGLGFASRGEERVEFKLQWPDGPSGVEVKAPTVALFNSKRDFLSFGFEAKNMFFDKLSDEERKYCYYFENFKMELHNKDQFDINDLMDTSNNKNERKLPIIKVFTAVIQYLKNQLFELLQKSNPRATYKCEDIQWIITVPAIWKSGARQLMREAAIKAELLERNNPRNLMIALEPEAAAIYVKKDTSCDYQHYLIIDCGGGTVDICVHEIVRGLNQKDSIREKSLPSGGGWGGIYVDKNFVAFLEKFFMPDCINKIKAEEIRGWHKLLNAFQIAKKNFKCTTPIKLNEDESETTSELVGIDINIDVVEKIKEFYNGKDFHQILNEQSQQNKGDPVIFKHGELKVTKQTMKSFFAPVIKNILQHLENLLKTEGGCYGVEAFYLVGGFSESKLLQDSISEMFQSDYKIDVVVPRGPQTAIVQGAVYYGMNPKMITERVANFTYGVEICEKFDSSKHNERKKFCNDEGVAYCRSLFKVLVKKNTPITSDNHEYEISLGTVHKNQRNGLIKLYISENPNITYTDEGAELKGKVVHKLPNPEKGHSRNFKVVLDFSGTEIYLIVTDSETNEISYDTIDFLHAQF